MRALRMEKKRTILLLLFFFFTNISSGNVHMLDIYAEYTAYQCGIFSIEHRAYSQYICHTKKIAGSRTTSITFQPHQGPHPLHHVVIMKRKPGFHHKDSGRLLVFPVCFCPASRIRVCSLWHYSRAHQTISRVRNSTSQMLPASQHIPAVTSCCCLDKYTVCHRHRHQHACVTKLWL